MFLIRKVFHRFNQMNLTADSLAVFMIEDDLQSALSAAEAFWN